MHHFFPRSSRSPETSSRLFQRTDSVIKKKTEDIRIELNGSEWRGHREESTQGQGHAKPEHGESEERILKEIGSRVKGFIMRNQEMHGHSHHEEILALKRQNDELQAMINQYRGNAAIDLGDHYEENR